MSDTEKRSAGLVPAICSQCGGQLDVDPQQEAAVCPYCGTPFIVEKAIHNDSIQQATIEHADTVNIHTKGAAESFFSFLGTQMSECRAMRKKERREQRAAEREIQKNFFRLFGILCVVMLVFVIVMSLIHGDSEESTESAESCIEEQAERETSAFSGDFALDEDEP